MLCLRKNKYHIAAALLTAVLLCPGSENFNKNSNLLAWWEPFIPSSVLWKHRGRRTVRKQSQDFISGLWRHLTL